MTGPGCPKTKSGKYKKHTPIVSEAQRRLFGAAMSGGARKATGLSKAEAHKHLKEVEGRKLPERVERKTRRGLARLARKK